MRTNHWIATLVIALAASTTASVFANDVFTDAKPIQNQQLEIARGGFEVVQNDLQLRGMVAHNSASHIQSGNNVIADGAFTNASGMPMVVQNSGSNVLIQNATIVNVQFQ